MRLEQPFLQHSIYSAYLNCGLLDVRWMCNKVQQAYQQGLVPLNAAEGFISAVGTAGDYTAVVDAIAANPIPSESINVCVISIIILFSEF